jgi:tetratricopeptide (TPR) repeat protein
VSDDKAQKLLQGGIKAARSGQKDLARKAFTQVLKLEPNNEAAWLGMATVSDDAKDKLKILKRILEINPANEQAKEALRRLGVEPERLTGKVAPEPEPIPESPTIDDDIPLPPLPGMDDDIPLPPLPGMDDDIPLPPIPGSDDDIPLPPLFGEKKGTQSAASDWGIEEDIPLPPLEPASDAPASGGLTSLRRLADSTVQPTPEVIEDEMPEIRVQVKSSEEVFAQLPPPPTQGQDGFPVPPLEVLERVKQEALRDTQAYLEEMLQQYADVTWEKKKRGRAGESEYAVYLLQVAAGVFVFLLIVGAAVSYGIYQSATAQRFLFGPSDTPMPTATFTPTHTPGPTNTPSQTPSIEPSSSPELDPRVTPGNPDQYFPPAATPIYFVAAENFGAATAVYLTNLGQPDEALQALLAEVDAVASFEFTPTYYLVIYYLSQGDVETAQQLIDDWLEVNQAEGAEEISAQPFLPYVDAAQARIYIYQAQQAITEGRGAGDLLDNAETLLTDIINEEEDGTGDVGFVDAYLLLAERHRLAGQFDSAIEVLTDAIQDKGFHNNTEVRMARARIYREQGRYPEALQELHDILVINPFLETALIEQIEVALESNQAGLAVLYSQQYLLYYPGSAQGFYLLGQARHAENKADLAINAYSRALGGLPTDPYYLAALQARTDLYLEQGEFNRAQEDLSTALDLSGDDPNIRLQRMNAAFVSGDFDTALEDAEVLLASGGVSDAQVLLLQGRILVDREEYRDGLAALQQATQRGLPAEQRSLADEYLARANLGTNNLNAALDAINAAIEAEDTGTRRYIRAQINQGRGDLAAALNDYEYVLTWGQIFPYPFLTEAQARYDEVLERLGRR